MAQDIIIKENQQLGVDKELITMFLKMSPEERLLSNDNTLRTIAELRNAFKQRKAGSNRPKHSA